MTNAQFLGVLGVLGFGVVLNAYGLLRICGEVQAIRRLVTGYRQELD